jgi:hypothetical protein
MKFELGVNALKALAVSSDYGKVAVGADEMAARLNVVAATAGLNNAFFTSVGLATREGRGRYKPTPIVSEFARKHSFNPQEAGRLLGPALRESWCFAEVVRQAGMTPRIDRDQMVEVLAVAAGATREHRVQLVSILEWLAYAGVIEMTDNVITVVDGIAEVAEQAAAGGAAPASPPAPVRTPEGQGKVSTKGGTLERPRAEPIMSLGFDFSITAEELKQLSAEQITALYQAVGQVMAIKATMKD